MFYLEDWKPYEFEGQPYYIIAWDWKGDIPLDEILWAASKEFKYMRFVSDVFTDDKVIIASKNSEFNEQAVYEAWDSED